MQISKTESLKKAFAFVILAALPAISFAAKPSRATQSGLKKASISLGGSKSFSLTKDKQGQVVLIPVPGSSNKAQTISFHLADWGSQRVLIIRNGYSSVLHFKARVCITNPTRCADTSIMPVAPGRSNYESWSDPIKFVIVSGFSLGHR